MSRIYLASSWRNTDQPAVLDALRTAGHDVYDFRNPAPGVEGFAWSDIDPAWEQWAPAEFRDSLAHPIAQGGFGNDWDAMRRADTCVLLLPSGRSAHIEAGYFVGHPDKRLHILIPPSVGRQEPELMYGMADGIHLGVEELLEALAVSPATRRTKRRYAHEMYPHPEQETRPLEVEVPYLYARAIGFEVRGTGWFDVEPRSVAGDRTQHLIEARHLALLADALLQGLTGQEAWEWADVRAAEESGEWIFERSEVYGVPWDAIKPYRCGPEPQHHDHHGPEDARGFRTVTRIPGRESDCEECTEPVEVPA